MKNPNGKPCTFGNKKCKWHHMCKYCGMIAEHKPANCPNKIRDEILGRSCFMEDNQHVVLNINEKCVFDYDIGKMS